jgi:hypothetical protein
MAQPGQFSRRKFAGVAAGAAAPLLAAVTADVIQAEDKQPEQAKPPSPTDRLLELIQQQYPDKRLDAAGLAEIREDLDGWLARSIRLSAYPLTNADEPGFVVRSYRKE